MTASEMRRRSAVLVGILLLLVFVLIIAGGSLGFRWVATTAQANRNATATAQTIGSLAGKMWHAQLSGTAQTLTSVVWSGTQFVAVGENGTILTSP